MTAAEPETLLTAREHEVAALVADGLSNREIAARLIISKRTVDAHLDHAFTKTGAKNRTQLAAWMDTGKLPPEPVPDDTSLREVLWRLETEIGKRARAEAQIRTAVRERRAAEARARETEQRRAVAERRLAVAASALARATAAVEAAAALIAQEGGTADGDA
jgi:DNA-binding CsgD family transcriptional regulator